MELVTPLLGKIKANTAVKREQRPLAGYVEHRGINKVNSSIARTKHLAFNSIYLPLSPYIQLVKVETLQN